MTQPWESGTADATIGWDVYKGLASVGAAGVATIAAIKTWARALARAGSQPGDALNADLSDAFFTRGINYLVANGYVTSDGTSLTAVHLRFGGGGPRALRRALDGIELELDPNDSNAERQISA